MSSSNIKTQKAMGVFWLQGRIYTNDVHVPTTHFITSDAELSRPYSWPKFGRPCPVTPRHGFVDSRIINNTEELKALWAEARAADPEAELMLMSPINAVASAILTPTMASIGPGNDGATAGKEGTINVALSYVAMPAPEYLIPTGTVPYAELVYSNEATYAVQWRSGPPVGPQTDSDKWIPADTEVQVIIPAHHLSALDLEHACEVAGPNTVVWQPGGNMISHAAVHARLHNLPIVFTSQTPRIGTRLIKNTGDSVPVMQEAAFRDALNTHANLETTLRAHLPMSTLWAIHQATSLCESKAGAQFVAQAATDIWRYAATACIGEARHSRTTKAGRKRRRKPARSRVYQRVLQVPANAVYLRSALKFAARQFQDTSEFHGGYGGKAWAQCAESALGLYRALSEAANGTGSVAKVITAAHVVVNTAHNNGKFLNKFVSGEVFDGLASGNWILTAKALGEFYRFATASAEVRHNNWPLLRNREPANRKAKAPLLPLACAVQWHLRLNTMLHVQCGTPGKYTSATLPLGVLSVDSILWIHNHIKNNPEPDAQSLYGSKLGYWTAPLPADVMTLLTSNLSGVPTNE